MLATDFEYDGIRLSDLGFVICHFGGVGGSETIAGSDITFNTVSTRGGMRHHLTSSEYSEGLTATFQICKNLCDGSGEKISIEDYRDITRWLCRREYHKLKFVNDEFAGIYFEASFNVNKIEVGGRLCGFELSIFTNRPYAIAESVTINIDADGTDDIIRIYNVSDEEGFIYPDMKITIGDIGDEHKTLEIFNKTSNRKMTIRNCSADEEIEIKYPMITSLPLSHNHNKTIMKDFDWVFFNLASSFHDNLNEITVNLPCSIELSYSPIVKIGI